MMNSPILAEWETQVRVRSNEQLAEQLRLKRLAGSPRSLSKGRLASLSPTHLQSFRTLGLARSSSLARAAWNRIQSLFYHPPVVEEECA
jgi:hypothetical protein